jgi:hypothetical protein
MGAVEVEGFREFKRELRAVDNEAPKSMRKAHRRIASYVQGKARSNAGAAGGVYAKARNQIRGNSSATEASIGVREKTVGSVAFWGAKKRTGWYKAARYEESTRQHPEWVGNTWDVGDRLQGPYVINYTIHEELDEIVDRFGAEMDELFSQAFND